MSLPALADYIRAHRPSAEATADLHALVERLVTQARHTSTLSTLQAAPDPTPGSPREADDGSREAHVERYEDLGPLGEGGMGEVRRVRDRDLNRTMAMKVIRADLMKHPAVLARFVEEAQCSAQLQHPGIVPVHELGRTRDGRVYFTMREVRGRTLGDVIAEVHRAPEADWAAGLRRLVQAFRKVCEAVGYAHSRGVVHRDLKPANVMLGEFGEVLVLDWGLAKVRGVRDRAAEAGDLDVVVTDRSSKGTVATRMGAVAGTPAYMPPEQARGEIDRIDAQSDVYALGAMLYEILAGRAPYEGPSGQAVLRMVLAGPPDTPGRGTAPPTDTWWYGAESLDAPATSGPPLPAELVATCLRAMAREPGERHCDAAALAMEVTSWLEGSRRREQALLLVEQAGAVGPEAGVLRERAMELRGEAEAMLAQMDAWEPEERKAAGWAKEDEATALERKIEVLELEAGQRLIGALQVDPVTPEAHAALAERHGAAHAAAEQTHDDRALAREEALLRTHATQAPAEVAHRWGTYLKGDGALTLLTDPPGAEVSLHRYEMRNRRLVSTFERSLGTTPLRATRLSMGSYLCIVRHPERAEVRYPVHIGRGEHWDGVPPNQREPHPVALPRIAELSADDCYVPAGWFWSGGDAEAADPLPRRRLWCDGLVVKRFPVTHREYLAFLDDLWARGREEEALRWAPRDRSGARGEDGALSYGRDERGRFTIQVDAEGDSWLPDWPVFQVNVMGAAAYGRWAGERTGQPWRLPGELEWEKAARGVDGRFFPWGDVLDPSWCCIRDSHGEQAIPAPVDSFPVDESAYGVRGMGGNVQDWCADLYRREGPETPGRRVSAPQVVTEADITPNTRLAWRGGNWMGAVRFVRCGSRFGYAPTHRSAFLGFRLVMSYPPAGP